MRYRISDTGIGMSEEFTKEVFEEFAQEDSDVRTQYHGVGLGMAIVKKYMYDGWNHFRAKQKA